MRKRNVGFLVFLLVVGFAAVSAVLVVNGTFNISLDDTNFTSDVIFSSAKTNDGTATINGNEQNIDFETKKLETVGDIAVLDFIVGNKSRQYDANVTINCGLKDAFTSFNEYFEITNDLASPFELVAGASKTGKLTVKLKEAYTEDETNVEMMCTLSAEPVSRDSVGEEYVPPFSLNGADPVLDEDGKLVPVTIANDGTVTYANENSGWHDYEHQKWANAVILVDSPSQTYNVNDTIAESDIESYFVWIPRYRYQIFDKGEYTSLESGNKPSESIAKEIQIVFEGKDTEVSSGSEVGDWLTHPAFTNYNTNGIWVGKFETGYKGATFAATAEVNATDASKVIVKPNVYSWRGITVSNIFKTALSYEENLNSHMMRNTEWGAVAYLSHSKYGINDEVRINNHSSYLTGYAANTRDADSSITNNSQYNTETGYLASTTGNITGIYDMSGGAWEYVAGNRENTTGSSGFTTEELTTYANDLDIYNTSSDTTTYNYRILGDATGEMGPFYSGYNNWYADYSYFVGATSPWFVRGGYCDNGSLAGQFDFNRLTGGTNSNGSFRLVLAFEK